MQTDQITTYKVFINLNKSERETQKYRILKLKNGNNISITYRTLQELMAVIIFGS